MGDARRRARAGEAPADVSVRCLGTIGAGAGDAALVAAITRILERLLPGMLKQIEVEGPEALLNALGTALLNLGLDYMDEAATEQAILSMLRNLPIVGKQKRLDEMQAAGRA